jgi:uncharacterized metal-binding protein
MMYFVILPIVVLSVSFRFQKLAVSVNEKDTEKIKAELFFLLVTLIIIATMVYVIDLKI